MEGASGALMLGRKAFTETKDSKEFARLAKLRKEQNRQTVDSRHSYIFSKLADATEIDQPVVEEFVVGDEQFSVIETFFAVSGPKTLTFFYQPASRIRVDLTPHMQAMPNKLFIASGFNQQLTGLCMTFIRTASKPVTPTNVAQEVNFICMDCSGGGMLNGLEQLLGMVFVPSLSNQKDWGILGDSSNGISCEFISSLNRFISVLSTARRDMGAKVILDAGELAETLERLKTPSEFASAANNLELLENIESLVLSWIKQIEQVLAQSEQMRKEADDIGPGAELEHWRKRMAKFNSLLDQIKSQHCRTAIGILFAARSTCIKYWKELDCRITDAANEAKDNVKYLYTLDRLFIPLMKCSPGEMVEHISSLMNAIRMIHSVSQYYNTSERMTSLFVKITNQMITTCKSYIMTDVEKIWELSRDESSKRLQECVQLNQEYQKCFHKTKNKLMENPNERQFEFSENYIFGKFDAFCKRLEKVEDMLSTIYNLAMLPDVRIEGIESISARYTTLVASVKQHSYNVLDHRKSEFDVDYEDFKQTIESIKGHLQSFLDAWFEKSLTTMQALTLLKKFGRIAGVDLYLQDKYYKVLMNFSKDIDHIKKLYQKQKDNPPVHRNMPPIAGKIAWSRQLYRQIRDPMKILSECDGLLKGPDAKKIVKSYNKLAHVLTEFEVLYHRSWFQAADAVKTGLNASLLIRHPHSKEYIINFDPQILGLIHETKSMHRMSLDIPEAAKVLCLRETHIKSLYTTLSDCLADFKRLIAKVPEIAMPLMHPIISSVDDAFKPGVTMLTWLSLNSESYTINVKKHIKKLELLVKEITDIIDYGIETALENMSNVLLCSISQESVSPSAFLGKTENFNVERAHTLSVYSILVETHTFSLIDKIKSNLKEKDLVDLQTEDYLCLVPDSAKAKGNKANRCLECIGCSYWILITYFNQKTIDALVRCTRLSLDKLRKKMQPFSRYTKNQTGIGSKSPARKAFFNADIVLEIPQILLKPSLEDIQHILNKAVQIILKTTQNVHEWRHHKLLHQYTTPVVDDANKGALLAYKSLTKMVSEHKDVLKMISMLSTIVSSSKIEAVKVLDSFKDLQELWKEEPNVKVQAFLESKPLLSEFDTCIYHYHDFEKNINNLPETYTVGSVLYESTRLKEALIMETRTWKQTYGKALASRASADMDEIFTFIDNLNKRLSRPIVDLEDVRGSMAALTEMRDAEIRIEMTITPIEDSFALLNRYDLNYSSAQSEQVDGLTYAWRKLQSFASSIQEHLLQIQPQFKSDLLSGVISFKSMLVNFIADYNEKGPMVPGVPPTEASERLIIFQSRFDEAWRKYVTYSGGEELFGFSVNEYPELQQIRRELGLLQKLYSLYNSVINTVNSYYDILWSEIDIDKITVEVQEFQNRIRKLPKGLKDWQAFIELKKTIDDFNECCPLLEQMSHKAMKPRHWGRISETTKHPLDIENVESFTLRNLMDAPLLVYKEDIEDVCISAVKERDIEAKLKQVISEWNTHDLSFAGFKSRGELLLRGVETAEIVSLMEDSLMILGSLLSNRYNAPFKADIQTWIHNLSGTSEIIESWLSVQNLWVYLEAVFVGGDIAKQLPQEAKRFGQIDKSWVKIMTRAHEQPNVILCCVGDETLIQLLPHLLEQLEICQKSLSGYLEKKRLLFPRFFFVSDPALLEILGQASDSHTIQAHLLGIFDNVKFVTFDNKQYDKITAINSRESEQISLQEPVVAQGNVESWLAALLKEAKRSLHAVIRVASMAIANANFILVEFLNRFAAQVGLLGLQMVWTRDSEIALSKAKTEKKIMTATNQYFLEILNQLIDVTTTDLTKFDRTKFETLVTIHVHQRDIFDELVKLHVKSVSDFEWLKQSRFYFQEDSDSCVVSITDVDFTYQNEFIGCTDRLVITPLTDRCYITLGQALHMSMGGAPAGPAGTGKTETVKDMGKALGKYVVVFNCSDQMDYRGLGRIYKGLAQSGSWGCFDEFNRIELPVLSVAAQQIYITLSAKKDRKSEFIFTDGDHVNLDPEFGLFLTMNPGYAGRQELPENLKIQFRTVAMMVPDRQIIMRVKLAACGFLNNIMLSRKFFTLYKLCEEQLSKQVHYDFGLRNILSVLRTLGSAKRTNPQDSEDKIVMRVLKDMNLSKLVDEDEPLFLSLIDDLFPGLAYEKSGYPDMEAAITKCVEEAKLVYHPSWILKLIQLYETQLVRHGMMVLGPSGTGKTTCINTLMKAMTICRAPHRELRMNPKAITAPQMFGRLDVATNDWTDGIFSALWRKTLKTKKGEHVWMVLDGPVDAIWIENLNSVLDDNKTLTLANGDRIPMSPSCKILFEPHNIDNASPATVSRNGMVYMSSSGLDWKPILQGWLNSRTALESTVLFPLFETIFDELRIFVETNVTPKIEVLECNQIMQAINMLTGLIPTEEGGKQVNGEHIAKLFVFAIMWSVGAILELDDRKKMEEYLVENFSGQLKLPVVATGNTIFEYFVDDGGQWKHWDEKVEEYIYPTNAVPEYLSILVPNVDNTRADFLIDTIAKQGKAVLLIGEQGTAKTVITKNYCQRYNPDEQLFKGLNFSSATVPLMFQRTIESYVDKRMGSTYGPPAGRRMTVFVDDINMPVINEWGDQITNEIVRQIMETKGFYSLEKPGDFLNIVDIQFIAAMIHPGGGRNDIPQRLKRQFTILNVTLPSQISIDKIFQTIGCGYFCKERDFTKEVVDMIPRLVACTRKLWQRVKLKMLPTPAKFHYIFNLRDLSRIWQGMLNVTADIVQSESQLLDLWKHECSRVISDRFVNVQDTRWFLKTASDVIDDEFSTESAQTMHEEPYFVDFLRDMPELTGEEPEDFEVETPKVYEAIADLESLKNRLMSFLELYNESVRGGKMDLVFFKDAITHLVKVSRIIRTPRGNALLVGVGGSGKQSLTRLASYIAGFKTFQIILTRSYNTSNLMDDLKVLYRTAGKDGNGITFIFTDNEIKDEGFLEYLNNVLASGEVSNLFQRDEIDEITQELIPIMKKEYPRRPPTNENLYDYFISRVKSNLHVVLCFSPVGEKFRNRALKFPGLISGCTMDWFARWPKDALVAVSRHFLSSYDMVSTPTVKESVVDSMGLFHDLVAETCIKYFDRFRRQTYVTPTSYLSFISGYKEIYDEKHKEIDVLSSRMNTGLAKLVEATTSVAMLAKELEQKEKELEVASKKADVVLKEVTASAHAAEAVKAEVLKVKEKAQAIVDNISVDKTFAEKKLAIAKPALAEAEAALQTIKPAHISTIRKLGKPPHLIMRVMDCVLILFQRRVNPVVSDTERKCITPSWNESLRLMSQGGFLQNLLTFPKDSITEEMCELLEPYLTESDYNLETAKKASSDVAGLLSWTKAMSYFFTINKEVLPLKANLVIQEARLGTAQAELATAQAELDAKQRELDIVQGKFDDAMREKQTLLDDAESCRRKMINAEALIHGLGGEKLRWTEQSKKFEQQIVRLVGDVLLATAFLSYSGPFNQEFRDLLLNAWRKEMRKSKIPFSEELNLTTMLADNATMGEWTLQGLPNDELSMENGIIVTKASRYPLLIDPQGQGKAWLRSKEANNELSVTALNHKYFRNHLEDALSLGRPLLLEDVGEELDPALDNVLEKNFIKSGRSLKVKVGDKEVDVMEGFRFYITTKLPNPKYTPEISAKTAIIDFTVTMKGLEDQLLGRVILAEKQELEDERINLMEEVTANKKKMKELEDNLLYRLTSTQGSLVDDESLVNVLRVTKETSEGVSEKLAIAAETELKINSAREEYRHVAIRGSILYFLIVELSYVNVMYQTALKQFLGLFDKSMKLSQKSPITAKRIKNIVEYLTYEVFCYSARGFYKEHKFLFAVLLTLKIDLNEKKIDKEEFEVLIKGGAALDLNAVEPKAKKWIQDTTWLNLVALGKLHQFSQILEQITSNDKGWKAWFDSEAPEEATIPDGYNDSLDTFRKLLLIRAWCPDRTIHQARKYISKAIGERFAEGVILNLENMWMESDQRTPMICLLSMGSDPTASIEALAKRKNLNCRTVSMGQGQEVHARRLLSQFLLEGGWVLLQNCHLGLNFLDELLDTITNAQSPNDNFRLWITTEEHPKFPINLLQVAIKFTNEPPQGVKAGLKLTYAGITQDTLDIINLPQWKPMLYATAFLHTVVQERRKFGPLGWNIPYEFNSSDLTASVQFIQNHLDELDFKRGISWNTVRYMLGEVQYGGRVTDDFDKRLLNTFCRVWFQENMFADNFRFYQGYSIPKSNQLAEIQNHILSLPSVDTPEVFGLHPNADITYQTKTAVDVLNTILNIQPKDSAASGGETRESIVYRIANDMLDKFPDDYIPHEVRTRLQKMGAFMPMNIFLRQELDRMQKVLAIVRSTLCDLRLAIDGTIIMSEYLKDALDNIFDARVPTLWKKVSWESTTLGFWFTELIERNQQFSTWLFNGRPTCFWMTGFFNPQGFLTAMRQEITRAHKGWALDSVVLANDVTRSSKEDIQSSPPEGVYVYGLFLDGAGWDRRNCRLMEPPAKVLFTALPVVHVYAVNTSVVREVKLFECPVYKKPQRTDLTYIFCLYLKTMKQADYWTLRGVAVLCDTK